MRRSLTLWIVTFFLTLATAYYQRVTGPTYPVRGVASLGGTEFRYRLVRSFSLSEPSVISLSTGDPSIEGRLEWRRHKTGDDWTAVMMESEGGLLSAAIPKFPAAAKLQYRIFLRKGAETLVLPPGHEPIIMRYKGDVPISVLVVHVIVIFGAMLLSSRTGLEYFSTTPRLRALTWLTVLFLFLGGMILGPVVQKYAFDAYWTGWPFGQDLTDNKTALALLTWIVAATRLKSPHAARWALGAAIVTLVVFLIPHSVLGSEFDYASSKPA